ncbi:MAG: hypothetical protein ABEJ62_02765 [Candidatus Nanohaloarchaea archaeon]
MDLAKAMMYVVLAFLVAGVLYGVASALLGQSKPEDIGRLKIGDKETLQQLVYYDTLVAYNCDTEGGGGDVMPSWAEYKRVNDFSKLQEAGSKLDCKGTEITAPLTGSPAENFVPGVKKVWRNDQEGEHSRKEFVIDTGGSDITLSGAPFSLENPQPLVIVPQSGEAKSTFVPNAVSIGYSGNGQVPSPGNLVSLTVLMKSRVNYGKTTERVTYTVPADYQGSYSMYTGGQGMETYTFRLCDGAQGYIQTNTGRPEDHDYTESNPPGENRERGEKDNWVHPFIVITRNPCQEPAIGLDDGDVFNGRASPWHGKTFNFGIEDKGGVTDQWGGDQTGFADGNLGGSSHPLLSMNLAAGGPDGSCIVNTNDGDAGGHDVIFEKGHMITQEGPISEQEVELMQDRIKVGTVVLQKGSWSGSGGATGESSLIFSSFDTLQSGIRRNSKGDSSVATERYFASSDGELQSNRFMARPEGELVCADYKAPGQDESVVQWVKCGTNFNSNDGDGRITVDGTQYRCEVSDDFKDDGEANWVEVS